VSTSIAVLNADKNDPNTTLQSASTVLIVRVGPKSPFRLLSIYTGLLPETKEEYACALNPDDQAFIDGLDAPSRKNLLSDSALSTYKFKGLCTLIAAYDIGPFLDPKYWVE